MDRKRVSRLAEGSGFGRRTGPGSNWLTEIAAREVIGLTQCTVSQRNAHPGALNRFNQSPGALYELKHSNIYMYREQVAKVTEVADLRGMWARLIY